MKIENGMLVIEKKKKPCWNCCKGEISSRKPCPKCNGTKKRGRGTCRNCTGSHLKPIDEGTIIDWDNPQTCPKCNGNYQNQENETITDYLSVEELKKLPVKVFYQDRDITWNEANLGLGCIYSCEDYGRAWKERDKTFSLLGSHQASKFVKNDNDLRICDFVGFFVNRGGYSVRACFNKE